MTHLFDQFKYLFESYGVPPGLSTPFSGEPSREAKRSEADHLLACACKEQYQDTVKDPLHARSCTGLIMGIGLDGAADFE